MPLDSPLAAPVIGISGGSAGSASVKAMIAQVESTGAVALLLANHGKRNATVDIGKIDALIVMGNDSDIDPAVYGAKAHPMTVSENATPKGRERAAYENAMLQMAIDAQMPVLGVCAGMQRINVLNGGSLHQHVPDLTGSDEHYQKKYDIAPSIPVQPVILAKDTLLWRIAQDISTVFTPGHTPPAPSVILENSMHHQAVNVVGEGLRPVAFSADKIKLPDGRETLLIEAIEADPNGPYGKQMLLGVQWHPEFGASPLGERIAQHVAANAQQFAQDRSRVHTASDIQHENMLSALPEQTLPPLRGGMVEMILKQRAAQAGLRAAIG